MPSRAVMGPLCHGPVPVSTTIFDQAWTGNLPAVSTGMIIDGVFASQATDSSGEVLDVEGCDISTLDKDGVANYEHKEGDKKGSGNNGEEIVGKIIYASKVFGEKDCENERQREYWDKVRVPFIYGMVRLYDGAGHEGAKALAAQIRDHHANGEPILVRFSIEGSTLDRDPADKLHLLTSVARRVALTLKPCNRTCVSGVVEDPRAPEGFDKKPAKEEVADLLSGLVEKGERLPHPSYTKLGGSHEFEADPLVSDDVLAKLRTIAKAKLLKALCAGSTGAAPGSLTQGSALQREDRGLKARAVAAVRDYGKKRFDKAEFRAFAKARLPEADDSFLDHFTDVAEDYHARRSQLQKKEPTKPARAKKPKPQLSFDMPEPPLQLTVQGKKARSTTSDKAFFDEKKGVLHVPAVAPYTDKNGQHRPGHSGGQFPMYIPSRDTEANRNSFHHILHDEKVNKFHDYAMENWAKVNRLAREGRLPPEVVMHATLFSQLSPNTPVPMQELMYGHLVDSMKHTGIDARDPRFGGTHGENVAEERKKKGFKRGDAARYGIFGDWTGRDRPEGTPQLSPEHWARMQDQIRLGSDSKDTGRKAGQMASFMLANNKFENMAKYHRLHDQLVELVNRHRGDARSAARELMEHKGRAMLHNAMRQRHLAAGKPDPGEYQGPAVAGLAPKTTRYTMGMLGGGNVHVPDTHFARYLFGLDKNRDAASIDKIKDTLWNENNADVLDAIDRYYAQHHDAVRHMLEHPKYRHLFEKPEDAVFPAFWKNWVSIAPHERARGYGTNLAFNEQTDHRPFWEAIEPFLKKSEDYDLSLPARTATLHARWVRDHGEVPALTMYYAALVPKLLARHHAREAASGLVKMEGAVVDLRKSVADALSQRGDPDYQVLPPVEFAGRRVTPGSAFTSRGKMALLHEDPTHYVAVPHDRVRDFGVPDMVRLPKSREGTHFWLVSRPAVFVAELDK